MRRSKNKEHPSRREAPASSAVWLRAKAESERLGFQYICMVNTDDIPESAVMQGLDMREPALVRAVLTDQPDGCLLGIRF